LLESFGSAEFIIEEMPTGRRSDLAAARDEGRLANSRASQRSDSVSLFRPSEGTVRRIEFKGVYGSWRAFWNHFAPWNLFLPAITPMACLA
jgi:hypothetical protein